MLISRHWFLAARIDVKLSISASGIPSHSGGFSDTQRSIVPGVVNQAIDRFRRNSLRGDELKDLLPDAFVAVAVKGLLKIGILRLPSDVARDNSKSAYGCQRVPSLGNDSMISLANWDSPVIVAIAHWDPNRSIE